MSSSSPRRRFVTFSLVLSAVVFGMVLAGGLDMTPSAVGSAATVASTPASAAAIGGLPSFADLAEAVGPAVVSIQVVTLESGRQRRGTNPFEFFFGPRQPPGRDRDGEDEEQFRSDSGGSGFIISGDGLVVTNFHVVRNADEVTVVLDGREYTAEVRGTDPATDIALLKIDVDRDLTYLKLGDSDRLRVGDWVMAIGSPLQLDQTVTVGVVSAKGRSGLNLSDSSFENFIQTDAAINFGNSGGPLLNLAGEVVGINTAINVGAENIGFAVPVSTLEQVLPQLRDEGEVRRGYLGVGIENLTYQSARAFGLEEPTGALIGQVHPDTPASRAGLEHGDLILSVDGNTVGETRDLIDYVAAQPPDATVTLKVLRNGEEIEKEVTLAVRPPLGRLAEAPEEEDEAEASIEWLGIEYQDLNPSLRQGHGLPDGVDGVLVVRVAPTSPLYEQRVRPGDIIAEINGESVGSAREFTNMVEGTETGDFLRLYVWRPLREGEAQPFFAFVEVP